MAYRPQVEMTAEQVMRSVLETERPRWNAQANHSMVIAGADGSVNRSRIRSVIDDLAADEKLIYAPAVREALQAAKERHPHYNFNSDGAERRILDQAEYCKFSITSPEDLGDVCEYLISQPDEKIQLSSYGREYQRQQTEAKQVAEARLRLLASILEGRKTTYPEWSPQHGKVRYIDAYTLESKTNEELAVIEREVSALRRRMGMDRSEQREDLHQFANQHREGYDDRGNKIVGFENRPKLDSLDSTAVRPYSEDPTKSAIVGRVVSEAGAVGLTDPFISPATGREFSKKEIYTIAKTNLALFRSLMRKDSARLNRIIN